MSYSPKLIVKMNGYLYNFLTYFEAVLHPSGGKADAQKNKRRGHKNNTPPVTASPDSLHLRAGVRTQNAVRRNPAP